MNLKLTFENLYSGLHNFNMNIMAFLDRSGDAKTNTEIGC
jgi:hypothetical protein